MNNSKVLYLIIGILFVFGTLFFLERYYIENDSYIESSYVLLDNLIGKNIEEIEMYADSNNIDLNISYEYSFEVKEGVIISQDLDSDTKIYDGIEVNVVVSKGNVPSEIYEEYRVNELGSVPIMMYHGIINVNGEETKYTGGNVDKDGYNRTADAFREDLEFYYNSGYRMIRLEDYVDGIIDIELGMSPIVLTFDDGNENNFKVLGEEDGELIIDPNCAVGILEEFKKKYPDFGVTATFFVNSSLFNQDSYNEKILKWLIKNGYDVGNHTMTHCDFKKIEMEDVLREVGGLYQVLDGIIADDYVNIVALPFGSPYDKNHDNYETILNGKYLDSSYETKAALRVGWEAELSCFDNDFDATYLKRIRAYDNNGKDFDIEMNFKILEKNRYISDGNKETIVVLEEDKDKVNSSYSSLYKITY